MTAAPLDDRFDPNDTDPTRPKPATNEARVADEAINHDAALAKAGDRTKRDALYGLFRPTMGTFVGRYAGRLTCGAAWDLDDVWQETFVVFAEVITCWPGRGDFATFYYAVFPKRLTTRVRLLEGRNQRAIHSQPGASTEPAHDPGPTLDARLVLTGYIATLPPIERQILALHVWEELPLLDVAEHLGISVTETFQRWRTMRRSALRHRSTPR